jgi:hypothetical protein
MPHRSPPSPSSEATIERILEVPYPLLEYDRWLREQTASRSAQRDYLFTVDKPRFEPRKDDVVAVLAGLQLRERAGAAFLGLPGSAAGIELQGVSRKAAERILASIDGSRCLAQVRWTAGVDTPTFARFLRAAFGLVVFAPAAVASLERAIPSVEVVRFPASPYAVERPYWENMAAVREQFMIEWPFVASGSDLIRLLRKLHVAAVMGPQLDSFYKPASPGSDLRVNPGALLHDAPRLLSTTEGHVFLDGPRVNASWVGGERWHRLVRQAAGQPGDQPQELSFEDDGLAWGRIIVARAEQDDQARPWFCPPRPWQEAHSDFLFAQLKAADEAEATGARADAVAALARFHQGFVRLHPFHCANQCLAMNLVNAMLSRVAGSGIPHLLLDHLALRMSAEAYERVFDAAVRAFAVVEDDPAKRLNVLRERRSRSFSLIDRLGACTTDAQAREALRADPEAAAWALVDSGS